MYKGFVATLSGCGICYQPKGLYNLNQNSPEFITWVVSLKLPSQSTLSGGGASDIAPSKTSEIIIAWELG
jgi:hypothetical protein